MKVAVFSTKPYDREFLDSANIRYGHDLAFFEPRLVPETASLAHGCRAVCVFVNDQPNAQVLELIAQSGTDVVALRCAGFNHVDISACQRLGISVVRVPAYSPFAVAEHTIGLILMLNRKLHRAYSRVREGNFSLNGLLGFDLHGKTAGILGTGTIGRNVARILAGFGCNLIGYDPLPSPECEALGMQYVSLSKLLSQSDIITLHCPLTPQTHHLIDRDAVEQMKPGVMLVNTSRGAVIDTHAVIAGLKTGKIGYLGIDVYEEEGDLFFEDLSNEIIADDVMARLLTFPNVVVTGHQAFFTKEALHNIADTTLANLSAIEQAMPCENLVTGQLVQQDAKELR